MSDPGPPPEQRWYQGAPWAAPDQPQQHGYPPQQGCPPEYPQQGTPQQGPPQQGDPQRYPQPGQPQAYPQQAQSDHPQATTPPASAAVPPVPQAPGEPVAEPAAPAFGQSPYGQGPAPAPAPATQGSYGSFTFPAMARQRLEPTAVASVVTSPLGIVGLILGLIGKRRVRTKQRRSPALAHTGIGLSALFLIVWILVGVVLVGNGTVGRWLESPQPGDVQAARTVGASNVALGNCIEFLPPGQSVAEVQLVPCAQPHAAQAISVHELDGDFPGGQALAEKAESTCAADVSALQTSQPVTSWYFTPTEEAWQEGTRQYVCLARSGSGTLEEDLVND